VNTVPSLFFSDIPAAPGAGQSGISQFTCPGETKYTGAGPDFPVLSVKVIVTPPKVVGQGVEGALIVDLVMFVAMLVTSMLGATFGPRQLAADTVEICAFPGIASKNKRTATTIHLKPFTFAAHPDSLIVNLL
jgi:hypothetical protein